MTDKKLTDKEIIKALECCVSANYICPHTCPMLKNKECLTSLRKNALDLINRLQAKVEKCEKVEHFANKTIATLQAENERLKNAYKQVGWERDCFEADNKRLYEIIENKNIKTEEQ